MKTYTVAILGATGAVGTRLIEQLEQSTIPVGTIKLLASAQSAGKTLPFKGKAVVIEEATADAFDGVDIVLASAGGAVSKRLLPEAVKRGAVCIDNTSAFRMDPTVPLVVPEVNPEQLRNHQGIIANPNCSTIQMVVALKPIFERFGLKQVIVSTYQAASGAGQSALNEFFQESRDYLAGKEMTANILPTASDKKHYPLAFNLLPQIDVFEEDGYTHEEWKMIHETKKILLNDMDAEDLKVTATCVRVPVPISHGESVYIEVNDEKATAQAIRSVLSAGEGLVLQDDPSQQLYPQPLTAEGKRETFVGRVRADQENPNAFHLWVVSDNLLKGAAWNTVEIVERLVAEKLLKN
ncbi:aspartate-semialdehyde dehydrogenase [Fructobacillus fructosus]|uniref:aspartate-semialdehyde dehydrogenase n=1 Tax=Fructobacillus fructosus TaxID=1631 RepID=UPI00165895BB|nr:aspartate-semialdehyde dehydrogenase [Fructobacillus fructosus]MBC9118803.1 aspartate-semialdehyde dehydrogenase [Fructobacillus fructosus]MBD9365467.1 aspartate-semialdehyde dehydrogenase [Leuconostoc mesenteroides]MCK8638401.1 aspartate-semialdehyde dehydrogenase [Fructobacillus fructosus]CAK1236687.1 Aspartate-semialdehyde dehydrogenase (Asd) [Fructobacillus fructosus]